jgi:hypothetical protein
MSRLQATSEGGPGDERGTGGLSLLPHRGSLSPLAGQWNRFYLPTMQGVGHCSATECRPAHLLPNVSRVDPGAGVYRGSRGCSRRNASGRSAGKIMAVPKRNQCLDGRIRFPQLVFQGRRDTRVIGGRSVCNRSRSGNSAVGTSFRRQDPRKAGNLGSQDHRQTGIQSVAAASSCSGEFNG